MQKLFRILCLLLLSFGIKAQVQLPSTLPSPSAPAGYIREKYVRAESFLFNERDTFCAKYPTLIKHTDQNFYYTNGNCGPWILFGGSGNTAVLGTSPITVVTAGNVATVSLDNTAVTPGSYTNTNLTVDAKGRITTAANGASIPNLVDTANIALVATTAALPAVTYSNGTGGVGATLTANANGVIAAIDNTTLTANSKVLIKNQATQSENGFYIVTDIGSAGTPFILTRATNADATGELYPEILAVSSGLINGGYIYQQTTVAPTVGTNNLVYTLFSVTNSGIQSVTGLNTDNTDSQNPIVKISVDGVTVFGDGTPASPLSATGSSGGSVASFSSGNLAGLFTTGVVNSTTNPVQSFSFVGVSPYKVWGRASGTGDPSYLSALDSNWIPTLHSEGYYNTKYSPIWTLTTTGTSGAATYSGNVLNIPQYPVGWALNGNAGIDTTVNFFGTTDANAVVIKLNNIKRGLWSHTLNSFIFGSTSANMTGAAQYNNFMGFTGMPALTSGSENSGMGHNALVGVTTGTYNVGIGLNAGISVSTGSSNTIIGRIAGGGVTTQSNNSYYGYNSGGANTGALNTGVGVGTLAASGGGGNNSALGVNALGTTSSGTNNVGLGYGAGYYNTTLSNQIFLATDLHASNFTEDQTFSAMYVQAHNTAPLSQNGTLNGRWGINNYAPTAYLQLPPQTTAAASAPLKLTDPITLTTTAATGTGTAVTITFAAQSHPPFIVGSLIDVAGVTPSGYNAVGATVTACTVTTITYNNTTTGAQTVAGTIKQGDKLMTTPEAGAVEYDGTHYYGTNAAATRLQLDNAPGGGTGWALTGNAVTAGVDFLGSTNRTSVRHRTNNIERIVVDSNGLVTFKTANPITSATDIGGNPASDSLGVLIQNNNAAINGTQQWSPPLHFKGFGWGTTASTSQPVTFRNYLTVAQGTTPTGTMTWDRSIGTANYATLMSLSSAGLLTVPLSDVTITTGALNLMTSSSSWVNFFGLNFIGNAPTLIGGGTPGLGIRYTDGVVIGTGSVGFHYLTSNYALFSTAVQAGAANLSTAAPASAVLEARSVVRGFLPPGMTTTQRNTISGGTGIGGVATGTRVGGSGYTNGVYPGTALTGGTGTGAIADITVAGGIVTVVTPSIVTGGQGIGTGYVVGDVLSASGLGAGSGFTFTVATISTAAEGLMVYDLTLHKLYVYDGSTWQAAW